MSESVAASVSGLARWWGALWVLVVAGGAGALVLAGLDRAPGWAGSAGSVAVAAAFVTALAARIGGSPVVFGTLAVAVGAGAVVGDIELLRSGAAVLTCVVSGMLAVLLTRPAPWLWLTLREVAVALLVCAAGALATAGFEPMADLDRFRYTSLGLALVGLLVVVFRLGGGLAGLGRRGLLAVVVAGVFAVVGVAYAELLQAYSDTALVTWSDRLVDWTRDRVDTFPAPLASFLGIPALVWGTYLRARRRQGWWVCAFGIAATVPLSYALVLPDSWHDIWLRLAATVVTGLVIGLTISGADAYSSARRERRRSRRRAVATGPSGPRPEPARWQPLG